VRDAEMRALPRRHAEKVTPLVSDLPAERGDCSGYDLEQSRLAGPVWPDDRDELALRNGERHA
jgi:hypothetical protein